MPVLRIEVLPSAKSSTPDEQETLRLLSEAGLAVRALRCSRLFVLEGDLSESDATRVANELLRDPLTEHARVFTAAQPLSDEPGALEIHPRPGVMDPVAESTLALLCELGYAVDSVRTARRYVVSGAAPLEHIGRALANDCIERVVIGADPIAPAPRPPVYDFKLRHIALRELDDEPLRRLSRDAHLFLSLDEMAAIRDHFRALGRDPTDLELETIAQTWSEHCVHKTLKSTIHYQGAAFPDPQTGQTSPNPVDVTYRNLLRDTVMRATEQLIAAGRGPECLSVFADNAGIIGLDDTDAVAFKVETHNHPSAIEPYGGAATGIGGCIRDIMGCGLGARPIANTDVFCVAPSDWPADALPRGVLHPRRVLRGVVRGVADYGNRMGIPTVNGAVCYDPRYLGNPLVYCGCVGLIPRDRIEQRAREGDRIVLIGGRTGRDGIHGATFSSAELTDAHADEFSHAVQIGNAITQKRVLDALLRARDDDGRCLYSAITDCGAGGLSSAVGEMGEDTGAVVDLETVPLKYAGLRYDEIWISEAQERMVLAVPTRQLDRLLQIAAEEEAEATVIGTFTTPGGNRPRLCVRYEGTVVGDLDMTFLHHGWPRPTRAAAWSRATTDTSSATPADAAHAEAPRAERLLAALAAPETASKAWIIRQYDHEVQGGSVIKPLGGPGAGPNDAAVVRPKLDSPVAIAIGCGIARQRPGLDPYWMAVAAIDEAIRNVVCVGGNPRRIALLDNFCWGRCDDLERLGALVRACQACHDAALVYGTPFISGKDSLNNEFALHEQDIDKLAATLGGQYLLDRDTIDRIRRQQRLAIPDTLLISAISVLDDARRAISADLKRPGNALALVGGLPASGFALPDALRIHHFVADAIAAGLVAACHDISDSGWLPALAEMAIGGRCGFELNQSPGAPLSQPSAAAYVLETPDPQALRAQSANQQVRLSPIGAVTNSDCILPNGQRVRATELATAWHQHSHPGTGPSPT